MQTKKQIDIVCVYNNKPLFAQMESSAKKCNDVIVNVFGLDNRCGDYASAAMAYNYAIEKLCESDVIVFCHQDIIWKAKAIDTVYNICIADKNSLFGAAGIMNTGKMRTISAITDYYCKYSTLAEDEIKKVFVLDECMIVGNKQIFSKVKFDPIACFAWDFYAVDLCLQCHLKNINVAVVGVDITHLSGGNLTENFYKTQNKIAAKYKGYFRKITTTCSRFYTRKITNTIYSMLVQIRIKIGSLPKKLRQLK